MTNQLQQVFNFNGEQIRTVLIDNVVWFVGNDVAKVLGYANYRNAVVSHVDDEDKLRTQIEYAGQKREMTLINESGVYALIFGSSLPDAKKFKHWVTSEVLPKLRKGELISANQDSYLINDPIERAKQWIKEAEEREQLKIANKSMEKKSNYYDEAMVNPSLQTTTEVAMHYGWSAQRLNRFLADKGVIYRRNGTWILKQQYKDKGFADLNPFNDVRNGKAISKNLLKWTQRGAKFIHDLLEKAGVIGTLKQMDLAVELNNIRKERD